MENKYKRVIEVKQLPSRKISYPLNTAVKIHPYDFGDIYVINSSNLSVPDFYRFVLEGIVVEGMPKEQLSFNDVVYLAWLRKLASLGSTTVDFVSYCPVCGGKNIVNMDAGELDFEDLTFDKLPIRTKLCGVDVAFSLLTIGTYIDLHSKQEPDLASLFAASMVSHSFEEAKDIILASSGKDIKIIDHINKILYHGLKDIEFTCTNILENNNTCGHKFYVNPVSSQEVELVTPFRESEGFITDAISFG